MCQDKAEIMKSGGDVNNYTIPETADCSENLRRLISLCDLAGGLLSEKHSSSQSAYFIGIECSKKIDLYSFVGAGAVKETWYIRN
jgi:hypothetical protein